MSNFLKVRLSLKGRPIRTYTFDKRTVSIGRDPTADIFLDNTGISREHALIDRTNDCFFLEDLGSANGTFLNDVAVTREMLGDDDVVRIGKFSLWVGLEGDRRDQRLGGGNLTPTALEGTMILSAEQMVDLTRKSKEQEEEAKAPKSDAAPPWTVTPSTLVMAVVASLLVGVIVGVSITLPFVH